MQIMVSKGLLEGFEYYSLDNIQKKNWVIQPNGPFYVSICGVVDSDEITIYINENLKKQLYDVKPVDLEVYLDVSKVDKTIKTINDNEEFEAESVLRGVKSAVGKKTRFYTFALQIIAIILFVISLIMLNSFIKLLVLERKKEIAIIKSFGAKDSNVKNVMMYDMMYLMLASLPISAVVSCAALVVLQNLLDNSMLFTFNFPILQLLIIYFIMVIVVYLYTSRLVKKMVAKTPAWLLTHDS